METAVLRSRDEILDMQDLVLRYDWACVDARVHHKEVPMLNSDIAVSYTHLDVYKRQNLKKAFEEMPGYKNICINPDDGKIYSIGRAVERLSLIHI